MVSPTAFDNATEFISVISPELATRLGPMITILKAAGIAFIIYVGYLIARTIMGWRSKNRIKKIEKKVNEIDEKLDLLLKGKVKKKEKKKKK